MKKKEKTGALIITGKARIGTECHRGGKLNTQNKGIAKRFYEKVIRKWRRRKLKNSTEYLGYEDGGIAIEKSIIFTDPEPNLKIKAYKNHTTGEIGINKIDKEIR